MPQTAYDLITIGGGLGGAALAKVMAARGAIRAVRATSSMPWSRWDARPRWKQLRKHTDTHFYLDRAKPTYIGNLFRMWDARVYRDCGDQRLHAARGYARLSLVRSPKD